MKIGKDETTIYPTHHMCSFCGKTFSDHYKEADWCYDCAEEIAQDYRDQRNGAMAKTKSTHQVMCKFCEVIFETKYDRKVFCCRLHATAWHNKINKHMIDEYKRMTDKYDSELKQKEQ